MESSEPAADKQSPDPEQFRSYLRLLARMQLPPRLAPKVDTSDVVQQTLIQAYQGLAGFRGGTEREMAGWLRRILANHLAHLVRDFGRQKRDAGRELPLAQILDESSARLEAWLAADQSSPSERAHRNDQLLRMAAGLETLPEEQREAVELHYCHGWTLAQIAEHLGKTPPSVAGLVHRGLLKLRDKMHESQQ
jgi:RNA polymerase sigma-70 factor (ECF subfamily)